MHFTGNYLQNSILILKVLYLFKKYRTFIETFSSIFKENSQAVNCFSKRAHYNKNIGKNDTDILYFNPCWGHVILSSHAICMLEESMRPDLVSSFFQHTILPAADVLVLQKKEPTQC